MPGAPSGAVLTEMCKQPLPPPAAGAGVTLENLLERRRKKKIKNREFSTVGLRTYVTQTLCNWPLEADPAALSSCWGPRARPGELLAAARRERGE